MIDRLWSVWLWMRRFSRRVLHVLPASHYVLLSLLFFAGLEMLLVFHRWILLAAAILLALMALGIVLVRSEESHGFHPTQAILPFLAAVGLTGFSLFVPTTALIHLHFALASLVFFLLLKYGVRKAYPTWNWAISHLVLFLNLALLLGTHYHLYIPLVVTLGAAFGLIALISFQATYRLTKRIAEAVLLAGAIGFVLSQVVWVLQFLPLHFFIQAGFITALYYVAFHLLEISYDRKLTRKDVIEYAALGALALTVILATARWS